MTRFPNLRSDILRPAHVLRNMWYISSSIHQIKNFLISLKETSVIEPTIVNILHPLILAEPQRSSFGMWTLPRTDSQPSGTLKTHPTMFRVNRMMSLLLPRRLSEPERVSHMTVLFIVKVGAHGPRYKSLNSFHGKTRQTWPQSADREHKQPSLWKWTGEAFRGLTYLSLHNETCKVFIS